MLPDGDERDRILDRLERHGHMPDLSAADPTVRDPAGNTLMFVVA